MIRRWLLLLIVVPGCMFLGCGPPRERVVLAQFDVSNVSQDRVSGDVWIRPAGVHQFLDGWRNPSPKGMWTTDERAEIAFEFLGRSATFQVTLMANPKVAARGQSYSVTCQGISLGSRTIHAGWQSDTLSVDIPDSLVEPGILILGIETTDHLGPEDGFEQPLGVFVQSFELSASLSRGERARWHEITHEFPVTPEVATGARPTTSTVDTMPDVLMILLDAARADHFSSYGYARSTTPNIDRLAAEGVRFEQVFATAPYTRSSVATLLTGRSWRDHGVLENEDALGEEHYTFPEALRDAGYQTLAISDNANVGINAGSQQGFDEFLEAWKVPFDERASQPLQWWPDAPVELFERRIRQGFDEQLPVFTYLHLLPPHEPYFPTAAHDRFGDPDYRGTIRGIGPEIFEFDRGDRPASGADFDRLVSLYDGGLHRGDALADRAIQAWRRLGRDRPTLIVVLSDHGEAFGEHGRFSHNTTPFDEMVHVPLILSPRSLVPREIQRSVHALHSLEDFYPMLLRTLGVGVLGETPMPVSFYATYDQPATGRSEVFIRCGEPRLARRTTSSLAVFEGSKRQQLFDLTLDPSASVDLRLSAHDRWLVQWRRLRAFLDRADVRANSRSELSPEDIDRLKALGYM